MEDLVKIREVATKYHVSARTLRYYEDVGLLESHRGDGYAYRLYDRAAIQRLEQILILRKLNISIKDIQRIFSAEGTQVVLEVLGKKVEDIGEEVALLQELREIVLEFIRAIRQADFGRETDVKRLYERAQEIEVRVTDGEYGGNPAAVHRFLEVTERLDKKVPDITIVRIPGFRAVSSGRMSFERIFAEFMPWQEANQELFRPVFFDAPDFLCGNGSEFEWIWAVKDDITPEDTAPYSIVEFPGGLYAAAVSLDGDGESHDKVRQKTRHWLENTNFEVDEDRDHMGHMIFVDEEIRRGLGYHQMFLYLPIRLRDDRK